jgi:tyrosyl-tRNA synthetase
LEEINVNLNAQRRQLMSFLDFGEGKALVVNNAEWLCRLNYIEFLRDFGCHFSVNQMLATEIYRERIANDQPLSFLEFNYQLLQAYDFLHLYREYGCTLQASGSDQWANCLAGRDLIRRVEGADAHVLTAVLLLTSDGRKMGKTEAGAVYLDPGLTPPYDFYQYWVNLDDADVERTLKLLTFLPLEQIAEVCAVAGAALREAKHLLAHELTRTVHGQAAADEAQQAAYALFGGGEGSREAMPTTSISVARLAERPTIVDVLVVTELCASRGEARRLVGQGGAYLNDERIDAIDHPVGPEAVRDGEILLRAGKKRYHRITVAD